MTDILEDCKFKLSSLSHTFVDLIMEDSSCRTYNAAVKLKTVLIASDRRTRSVCFVS